MSIKINGIQIAGVSRAKSAYEIAVENGFEGTEEQFNLALSSITEIPENLSEFNNDVGYIIANTEGTITLGV